jgi:hypothetical protein
VTGREGRRLKHLLDYLKERLGYWELTEEAPGRSLSLQSLWNELYVLHTVH